MNRSSLQTQPRKRKCFFDNDAEVEEDESFVKVECGQLSLGSSNNDEMQKLEDDNDDNMDLEVQLDDEFP